MDSKIEGILNHGSTRRRKIGGGRRWQNLRQGSASLNTKGDEFTIRNLTEKIYRKIMKSCADPWKKKLNESLKYFFIILTDDLNICLKNKQNKSSIRSTIFLLKNFFIKMQNKRQVNFVSVLSDVVEFSKHSDGRLFNCSCNLVRSYRWKCGVSVWRNVV